MPLSRRSFLATAAGFALAACSRSGEQSTQVSATSTTTSGKYTLVSLFDGPGGEVYSDADRIDDLADATPTDLVRTLALRFEPSPMLARPGGRLTERLDHLFDASELDEALTRPMTDR